MKKKKKVARRPKGSSYTKTVTLNSLFDFLPNTPGPLSDVHTCRAIKRAYRNPYPSNSGRYITRNANVFEFQGHQLCLDGLTYKTMTEEHNEFAIHSLGQVFNVLQNWTNLREKNWAYQAVRMKQDSGDVCPNIQTEVHFNDFVRFV